MSIIDNLKGECMSYTDFDFPHTSLYTSDLREVIANIRRLEDIVKTFVTTEQVKFADPITWNITSQYAKTTVVLDTSGNAYLSKQAVPTGIELSNEEYWQEIFNFTDYTRTANRNLTVNVETNTTRATDTYEVDDWLIWNDVLYRVTAEILIDDTFIIGTNIVHFTVEDFIKAFITYATGLINQYKDDIDASELAYHQEMQAEVDRILAGATVDSEVIDARLGFNGVNYTTLGIAIRTQMGLLNRDNSQHIALENEGVITYDSRNKTITFPSGGFYFYDGRGHANSSSHTIDLTSILNNNACAFWIASDYSITATSWGTRPNDVTSQLIGFMYKENLIIFGVDRDNIRWINSNGSVYKNYAKNDGTFLGSSGALLTWNRDNLTLTVLGAFFTQRGIAANLSAQTVDMSIIDSSGIYKVWIKSNGTIYGTKWGASGVAQDYDDSCIGFIWDTNVYIEGCDPRWIKVIKNTKQVKPVQLPNSLIGIAIDTIIYDYDNKILTIPGGGFSLYCGEGFARGTDVVLNLSSALDPSSEACVLALGANKNIYAIDWDTNNFNAKTDTIIGYVFKRNVFIYGIKESQIHTIDSTKDKKIFCFGDSIVAGVNAGFLFHMQYAEWNYRFKCYNWGVGSTGYVKTATGDVVVGGGVIGDGNTQTQSGNNSIIEVMQSITDAMPYILIEGGTNDWSGGIPISDFRTAVQNTLDYAITKTSNIFVITPFKRNGWATNNNSQGLKLVDYANVIIEECEARGICYFNGYDVQFNPTNANSRASFAPDGLHPNDKGHRRIARATWERFLEAIES